MSGFEVIGKPEKGIETDKKQGLIRASHKALIESLSWIKGPLFLKAENHVIGLDMIWVSKLSKPRPADALQSHPWPRRIRRIPTRANP